VTPPISKVVLWITGVHVSIGLVLWAIWLLTQDEGWIRYYFDYQSPIFFISFAGAEVYFSLVAFFQFSAGERMRTAWCFIALASLLRLIGLTIAHLLSVKSLLNPAFVLGESWTSSQALELRQIGLAISGPIHMAVLACGLYIVLTISRRFKMLATMKKIDYFLIGIVCLFTLRQLYEIAKSLPVLSGPITVQILLQWVTDPLLSILLFEAILIRRCVLNMGWGYIAKCWGAFTAAIFISSLGNMGIWASNIMYNHWPMLSITWFIWFFASAAYVLGPAYQVEARYRTKACLTRAQAA
jgi:hypothetical protein